MIQELLGGTSVGIIGGERSKLSDHPPCGGVVGGILDQSSPCASPSPSSSAASGGGSGGAESLRCPRCDSANTKFCYYNNYNLTQPRHFCKTCRRYWTKGGALRNVPIGGGCRKNKTTFISSAAKSTAAAKSKSPSPLFANETLSSNPIIWASSQNSHFLSLIRGNNQTLTNPTLPKEDASPFASDHFSSRALGLDHLAGPAHFPSLYRNQTLVTTTQGILHGEAQNHGLQELYHKLRFSSSNNYFTDHAPAVLGNMGSANSSSITTTAVLESAPVAAPHEMGFWNSNMMTWPADLSTSNGTAYP